MHLMSEGFVRRWVINCLISPDGIWPLIYFSFAGVFVLQEWIMGPLMLRTAFQR
jgi:hypothetical protein